MPRPKLLSNTHANAVLTHATHPCHHMGRYYTEHRPDGTTKTVCAICRATLSNGRWSA